MPTDKSATSSVAIESYNTEHDADIQIRQIKFATIWLSKTIGRSNE